jgi:hypothetical protein
MDRQRTNLTSNADNDVQGFGGSRGGSGDTQWLLGLNPLPTGLPVPTISRVGSGSKPGGAGDGTR